MEEEDAILNLAPASEIELALPSMNEAAGEAEEGRGGWSFERALQAQDAEGREEAEDDEDSDNADEEDDGDDDDSDVDGESNHDDDQVGASQQDGLVFRDGDAAASSSHGGATTSSSGAAGDVDDAALLAIGDKKAAKRLGKKLYKRWKKLNKRAKKHKSSSSKSKSKKKEKKSSSSRKSKSDGEKKSRRKKRSRDEDEDDEAGLAVYEQGDMNTNELGLVPAIDLSSAAADIEERLRKAALRETKMRTEKASRKAAQLKSSSAETTSIAKELVAAMAKARRLDEDILRGIITRPGVFPLHRVALKELVQARCRQAFLVGPLVEAGILQELSYWLYDVDRAEPAPYELRTTTLDLLTTFPLEGSIALSDDLTQFAGVSREHLIRTDMGRALNALRKYPDETVENRSKCVQLLTSFSRVISGAAERDQSDENKSKAVWKCQGDPTVASPFEAVGTGSEALMKSFMKPDPRDPTSYNGLLPWRGPAATITNVSGKLNSYIEKAADPHEAVEVRLRVSSYNADGSRHVDREDGGRGKGRKR